MPCLTVSTGVTSCGRRGSGFARIRGAAGVDRMTLAAVEDYGVDRMLRELRRDLRTGYRPAPARRVEIPKPRGRKRPLGIPTVRDRVAQQAAKLVLEPIFEADFLSCSFGFRPRRSATMALERLRRGFLEGYQFVFEFDIANFFGEIDHDRLLESGRAAGLGSAGAQTAAVVAAGRGVESMGWCRGRSRALRRAG